MSGNKYFLGEFQENWNLVWFGSYEKMIQYIKKPGLIQHLAKAYLGIIMSSVHWQKVEDFEMNVHVTL